MSSQNQQNQQSQQNIILVVEDDDLTYNLVEKMLLNAHFEVLRAKDGARAVDEAAKNHPSLILMDLRLPKIDGWHAAKQIQAIKQLKDTPILAMTAEASFEDEHDAFEAGCHDYIRKPIEQTDLIDKIHQLLSPFKKLEKTKAI